MKRTLIIAGVVVVLVVVGVVTLYSSLGSIIKTAVETFGTEIVGAKVTLNSADVSATDGTGELKGLTVGNPQPFKTDAALRLGQVKVTLDTGSITSDVVHIKEVLIAAPEVTYELSGTNSNLDAIQKNVDAYVKKMGGGASQPAAKSGDDKGGPKLVIDRLLVQNGQIRVSAGFLGGKTLDAPLPTIELKDIGKDKGGAGPGEVAEKVVAALKGAVTKGTASLNLDKLMTGASDLAKGAADAVKSGASGATQKIQEGTQGATDAVKQGVQGAGDALKGLFGGKK